MMPRCCHKGCRQTGIEYFGKVWDGEVYGRNQKWEDPIYLCPKHAKKLRKMLCIDFERNK